MIMQFLADTMTGPMIPGEWLTGIIVAIIGAVGSALVAYKKGAASATETRLADPVPEVPVRKVYSPPTYFQHQELVRRVGLIETEAKEHREQMDAQLRDIRREQSEQFVKLMNAGEVRKDAIMESMNSMVRAFHARVDQLIDGHRSSPTNRKP